MTKELDEKIKEIEEKFPEIKQKLKEKSGGSDDWYWKRYPENVQSLETERYEIVALLQKRIIYPRITQYSKEFQPEKAIWTEVYYKNKNCLDIKLEQSEVIITQDMYSTYKGRIDLWGYDIISLKKISEEELEIALMNDEGDKKLNKRIKLD